MKQFLATIYPILATRSQSFLGIIIFLLGVLGTYSSFGQNPFVTTWKTDNPGTSDSTSITIPTVLGHNYNYDVDWDNDGTFDEFGLTGDVTHDFQVAGTYTFGIRGSFPMIRFNNQGDRQKIINIDQWGDISWSSMQSAFLGASNLNSTAIDAPNLTNVTNMYAMFKGATSFNADISNWDVSHVTRMQATFEGATSFNADISNWDVSQVTNMSFMLAYLPSFNADIKDWDVSNVTDMSYMFHGDFSFNANIKNWDVSQVTDMRSLFFRNTVFNADISKWDVSKVTYMKSMFYEATTFNQDISSWDVGNVTNMSLMFNKASSFNMDIKDWDVSKVINMSWMFSEAVSFNADIKGWDVSHATDLQNLFFKATSFNADIKDWDVSQATDMSNMFYEATSFNTNLGHWNISKVTQMDEMLSLSGLDITNYDKTLIGWVTQETANNISLGATNLKYCNGELARSTLINVRNWDILLDHQDCTGLVPLPTALISPTNGATNIDINTTLTWSAASNITGYKLSVGTVSGNADILNNTIVGHTTTYDLGTLQSNTTYFVTITPYNDLGDAIGCTEESFTTAPTTVALQEQLDDSEASIYPNPASDLINIELSLAKPFDVSICVTNALGKTVFTKALDQATRAQPIQISTKNINNGVYFVTVYADRSRIIEKIIVTK